MRRKGDVAMTDIVEDILVFLYATGENRKSGEETCDVCGEVMEYDAATGTYRCGGCGGDE